MQHAATASPNCAANCRMTCGVSPISGTSTDCTFALLQRVRNELRDAPAFVPLPVTPNNSAGARRHSRPSKAARPSHACCCCSLSIGGGAGGTSEKSGVRRRSSCRARSMPFLTMSRSAASDHAGHVNQLSLAHPAAVCQHRHHIKPRGATAADARHRLARLHVKREHLLSLVTRFLHSIAVINQHTLACQRIQHAGDALAAQPLPDVGYRQRLPRLVKQREYATRVSVPLPQRGKVGIGCKRIGLVALEPQSCGAA